MGKSSKFLECLFAIRQKISLSVYVDDVKLAGKKKHIDPMWNVLMKRVDLGEPTSFLDNVYLGCTQRESKTSEVIVEHYRICLNRGSLVEQLRNCQVENLM